MNNDRRNEIPAQSETIAVAMSGGVDSAVALCLAKETAGKVFGITAIMTAEESRCCSPAEVMGAAEACRSLGVEHFVVEVKETFRAEVIDYFSAEYLAGRTPSPCVKCNRYIKFGELLELARGLGADSLATGHYARRCAGSGRWQLCRGKDRKKDQSYFLAMLSQEQVAAAYFPVGELTKAEVRKKAAAAGLKMRGDQESQEVCFITEGSHGNWIDVRSLKTGGAGDIVDMSGNRLGRHAGIHHYTVGQRRGLGVASDRRLFVVRIDRASNQVVLGTRDDALSSRMKATGLRWIDGQVPGTEFECDAQIRYSQTAVRCRVTLDGDAADVEFEEPQFGVAPGQLSVFYDGEVVLGGGWIC